MSSFSTVKYFNLLVTVLVPKSDSVWTVYAHELAQRSRDTDLEAIKSILPTGLNKLVSSLKKNGGEKRQNILYITDLIVLNSVVPEHPLSLSPTSTEIHSRNPQKHKVNRIASPTCIHSRVHLRKNLSRGRDVDSS